MLIPFPSPPALRKIPDDTFAHIAAAVDPPEIVVDLTPVPLEEMMVTDAAVPEAAMGGSEKSLSYMQVNVVKQEAVGMYEVAVLEAGSAAALNQWMEDHDDLSSLGDPEPLEEDDELNLPIPANGPNDARRTQVMHYLNEAH